MEEAALSRPEPLAAPRHGSLEEWIPTLVSQASCGASSEAPPPPPPLVPQTSTRPPSLTPAPSSASSNAHGHEGSRHGRPSGGGASQGLFPRPFGEPPGNPFGGNADDEPAWEACDTAEGRAPTSPSPSPGPGTDTTPSDHPRPGSRAGETGTVSVAVRVRPFLTAERVGPSTRSCVQCLKNSIIIENPSSTTTKPVLPIGGSAGKSPAPGVSCEEKEKVLVHGGRLQQFNVNQVFNAHCSHIDVYTQSCRSIVRDAFLGINGCILAYGATGSGKTHIMFGGPMSAAGIVYQAMRDIFEEVSRLEREAGKVVKIKCCFLEIYNEEVFDLLLTPPSDDSMNSGLNTSGISGKPSKSKVGEHPSPTSRYSSPNSSPQKTRVQLQSRGLSRKDAEKHSNTDDLHISGLSYIYPKSLEEFARRIEHGHSNRVVATTDSNTKSSRSHAIITVEIKVLDRGGRNSEDDHRGGASDVQGTVARINFCDLAGSERAAATTNSGVRLREGGSINRSLLALSAMVRGLIQKKRHPTLQKFVPYRGSKLTRLLSGSIGGNSRTLMLFCLSPCSNQYEESVNTMHFAMQVKQIQVNAKRNEYHVNSERVAKYQGALIEELYSEIGLMRMELARLKGVQSSALLKDGKFTTAKNDKREGLGRAKPAAARAFLVPSGSNDSLTMRVCSPLQLSSFLRAQSATRRASKASTTDVSLRSPLPLLSVASTVASFAEPVSPLTPLLNSAFRQISSSEPTTGPFSGNATQGNREAAMNALPPAALSKSSSGPSPQCSHFLSPESTGGGGIVYTELEQRLRRSAAEKETLYHQLRDIQEQQSECDIRLRAHKWKLAQFLVNSSMNSRGKESSIEGIDVMERDADDTPVGIIGLQQLIQRTEEESAAKGKELTKLSLALEWCDNRIQETRQSLLREPTSEMLELLLDNARLRDSYTEAEGLAAQYYQESRVLQNRQSEYVHALSLAVGAIRALLPNVIHDRASAHVVEHARSVLLYALLPSANTSDMIAIFQNALHADTAELLPPLHPFSSPKASQQQEEARPHLSRRDRTGDQEGERQKLQEHYQELVEVAELFRSTFAPYERGMRRASDFIVKADPPDDASKEDSHAPSLVGGESGGEEDGAPTPALVEQITPASPPDPPNGGEGFSMSGLDDFPSAYPVKNERVAGVEATTPSPLPPLPAKPHARRAVKPPEAALARAAFSKSGNGVADRRVRAGSQSSTSRFTRAGPSAPSDDPLFSPGKGSVRAFAPTQIYTGSSPQKQKLSSSLIRNNTALETPFGSVSSLPEVKAPSLVHLFKQNGRFCRAHTIPSVAVANSMNRPNSSSSSSVMSKAQNKVRKKQTFLS